MLADGRQLEEPRVGCGNSLMVTDMNALRLQIPCMLGHGHPGDCAFESEHTGTAQGIYLEEEYQYVLSLSNTAVIAPGVTVHVHLTRE